MDKAQPTGLAAASARALSTVLSPVPGSTRARRQAAGFTLTELMAVVAILAVLAMIAVPALSGDSSDAAFERYVTQFARDIQRAHTEAISSAEDRTITFSSAGYAVNALVPGTPPVESVLYRRRAGPHIRSTNFLSMAADRGRTYTPPTSGMTGSATLRFNGTGGLSMLQGGNFVDSAVTIFFEADSGDRFARLVIYQATCFAKVYWEW